MKLGFVGTGNMASAIMGGVIKNEIFAANEIIGADLFEPGRDKAPNLKEIRKMSFIDIDEAMYMILKDTLDYLDKGEGEKDELTRDTYLFYKNIHDMKQEDK